MSYCRFENTARDLSDCLDAIKNGEIEDLSSYERRGLNELLYFAERIVHFTDDIKEILEEYENN